MKKKIFILFLLVGAASMLTMSFHYFQHNDTGILKGKAIARAIWYRCILRAHIAGGLIAIIFGPFQFSSRLRSRNPARHKSLGYLYFGAVLISGTCGLVIAQYAMGGWITSLGFSILSVLWLWTSIGAIRAAVVRKIELHCQLMLFSYALTFAAIPQRLILLLALLPDIEFIDIYQLSSWLSWLINLAIVYKIYTPYSAKKVLTI